MSDTAVVKEKKIKPFYYKDDLGKKAANFLSKYHTDEFTDEFVNSIPEANKKYLDVFKDCVSGAEKRALLRSFVKIFEDKTEQKQKFQTAAFSEDNSEILYVVQAVNPRAHSNLGVDLDIRLETELFKLFETTNTGIDKKQLRKLVLDVLGYKPTQEVDSRFMWRMIGRSTDPLRVYNILRCNFRTDEDNALIKIDREIQRHLGKKINESVPSEVVLEPKATSAQVSASCFHNE
jgi:hypothetical protein